MKSELSNINDGDSSEEEVPQLVLIKAERDRLRVEIVELHAVNAELVEVLGWWQQQMELLRSKGSKL